VNLWKSVYEGPESYQRSKLALDVAIGEFDEAVNDLVAAVVVSK